MSTEDYTCWKCGEDLGDTPLPLGREARCKACQAHLHCCRLCIFYDTTVSKQCREPIAEPVKDKTRSNFCGYLQINPNAFQAKEDTASGQSMSELESLFGMASSSSSATSSEDENLKKLNELFNDDK